MLRSGGAPRQKPSSYKKETTKKVYKKAAVKNGSSGNLRKPRKKPDWDSSNNDLDAHKLSRQEMEQRHKSYQSMNLELAKHELYDKAKKHLDLDCSGNLRPSPLSSGARLSKSQKLLAIQQSLHSSELHDVLAYSDHSMRIVRDLFGDDPKRYTCQPNVTVAPNVREKQQLQATTQQQHTRGGSSHATALDSPGGIWDDSMQEMIVRRKPALNDSSNLAFGGYEGDERAFTSDPVHTNGGTRVDDLSSIDDSGGTMQELAYKSVLDIHRFQKLLEQDDHTSHSSDTKTLQHKKMDVGVDSGPDMDATRQLYIVQKESGQGDERRIVGLSPDTAKGVMRSDSVCGVSDDYARRDGGDVDAVAAVCELSSISMEPDVQGQGDNITVDSEAVSIPPLPSERISSLPGSNTGTLTDHPLLVSCKMPVQHGSLRAPCWIESGFGGDSVDPALHSERTSKIHADLTRLEKVVHGLDQKLAAHKRSVTNTSSHKETSARASSSPPAGSIGGVDRDALFFLLRDVKQQLEHSESQLMGEVAVRGQFLQTLTDQQDLIDNLTANLLNLQRGNVIVKQELANVRCQSIEQVAKLKEEIGYIRCTLSSIVQQSQPYSAIHSTPHSHDDYNAYSQTSHDILSQMSHDQVSDSSRLPDFPSQSEKCKAVTVLRPDLSIDTNFSFLAQPWVELKPKTDKEFPAPANNRISHVNSTGILKGELPRYVPAGSCGRVVYAQVSPFSYSDDIEKKVLLPSASPPHEHNDVQLPISFLTHESSAKNKSNSLINHCDPLPTYHSSAPPLRIVSGALQIPPSTNPQQLTQPHGSYFQDSIKLSKSLMSINSENEVQKTSCSQTWVEESKTKDTSILTSTADMVPNGKCQASARIDAPLEELSLKSFPMTTEEFESVKNTGSAGTTVQKNMESFPPEAASRHAKHFVAQSEHNKASYKHAHGSHHRMQKFDVTALLESLKQLDTTKDQLKATADRLDQKFALSSSALLLNKSNSEHGQNYVPSSSSPSLACFTNASSTRSEDGELEVQQRELVSVLTPILEESTLTGSQLNTTLDEYGSERDGSERESREISSNILEDQPRSSPLASTRTTECGIKSLPLISEKDNGLEAVSDKNNHLFQRLCHSSKDDNGICVGSSSILSNTPVSRSPSQLRQINPELQSTGSEGVGVSNPGTWFSLRSHLAK